MKELKPLDIDLRYCQKCKRLTLQVKAKILTIQGNQCYAQELIWRTQTKKPNPSRAELNEIKESYMVVEYYCPQCGTYWTPTKEEIKTICKDIKSPKFVFERLFSEDKSS